MSEKQFNPLSYRSLGEAVVRELVSRPVHPLPPSDPFPGAGIYAIYATAGEFGPYRAYGEFNDREAARFTRPIYVGKAVPRGSRRGGGDFMMTEQKAAYNRLRQHSRSIDAAENLDLTDFYCRYLIVAPAWIRLAETLMIREYRPLWNRAVDGFGNHDPGSGRYNQERSKWDVLHPGRSWAERCAEPADFDHDSVAAEVRTYLEETLGDDAEPQAPDGGDPLE